MGAKRAAGAVAALDDFEAVFREHFAAVPGGMQGDSFMDIGQIQCPSPDACVAIGVSDQGSTSTPIYTNHG